MASSAMPKPAAANVAANNSREIASGLFLVLFSIRQSMKYNGILDLFNETTKYNWKDKRIVDPFI
jgi:hypothetical protein